MHTSEISAAIGSRDRELLLPLAERRRSIAESAENLERRALWLEHDRGRAARPLLLFEDLVAFEQSPRAELLCADPFAREIERTLRHEIYRFEVTGDDWVFDPEYRCPIAVDFGDYGLRVEVEVAKAAGQGNVGSRHWEHPVKDIERDLGLLRPRCFSVDRKDTELRRQALEALFEGILEVRLHCPMPWTLGMTQTAIHLIGLEQIMMAMVMSPDALHALMAFLRDDHLRMIDWLEREELLTPNNGTHYVGSGTIGLSDRLPAGDHRTGAPLRAKDMWVLSESQETVGVGPDQFAEFIFPCQKTVAEKFGATYYGCCEPLDQRWHVIRELSNLCRVSISPWCDQEKMAGALGRDYVFCRKPHPTLVSMEKFDEDAIREDLRKTLAIARDNRLEIVMKDVHTLNGQPGRAARWVEIAREEIERAK